MIDHLDTPEAQAMLAACHKSTKLTATTFFPDDFYSEMSILHHKIFDLIDSGARKIAIAAPRGIGKTTIARTLGAKSIIFRDINFIAYLSNSATSAELQTENMKRQLLTSTQVRDIFGNIKESDFEYSMGEQFSKKAWVAYGKTLILPRGAGQQVRGLNWAGFRPQLIIVDDLEDKEEIINEDNRNKIKAWFFADVMKSVNRFLNDWVVVYIDTIKHEDSLLANLVESSEWASLKLSICDENFKSYVPEYMTDEEIAQEYEEHREKGLTDLFYMEFMNIPVSAKDAAFKPEYVKYYNETDPDFQNRLALNKITNFVIIDPAKTVKLHSAESGIVVIGIDQELNKFHIRAAIADRYFPDELYDEVLRQAEFFKCVAIGVEVTSLEQFITQPLKNEMMLRGLHFLIVELRAVGKKEHRPKDIVPFYRSGYMYHNQSGCRALEAQLFSYPRPKRWDLIDALAYLPKMLDIGELYFSFGNYDEDPDDDEAEFRELEYEEPLTEWRVI